MKTKKEVSALEVTKKNLTEVLDNDLENLSEFDLNEFIPEIYDCEADGCCSNGHQHVTDR